MINIAARRWAFLNGSYQSGILRVCLGRRSGSNHSYTLYIQRCNSLGVAEGVCWMFGEYRGMQFVG